MISKSDIAKKALKLRQEYKIESYGIKDIFNLIERMDIDLIRYPFGKDVLCGFATVYRGKKIIVSNTSEILSREIYTIAHELGHIIYDFNGNIQDLKIDIDIDKLENNLIEKRANYFAACFLMPEILVEEFIKYELKKPYRQIEGLDIVRIQIEFNVSYSTAVIRLHELGLITEDHRKKLFNERRVYTSGKLFKMINADERLLKPTELIKVPSRYLEFVISNYEKDYIPYSSFKKALELIGLDSEEFKKEVAAQEDEIDIDELFEEFE
ncbi:ImmA/IrrE family metallo-endopeptidase [Caloranaerobacter ferrireducens]|uniref:ImmA/IrrE family metallo-endopeptidase n=1 Tax=Caloranaerobacter ferrireducens TaxID=1323370 RepID=UPI0009F3498C|nr:ImmA/IrrE family metallo-endopeptidase [Caloranaerobacter ferrireducens]